MDGAVAHLGADNVQNQDGGDAVQSGALEGAACGDGGNQHHDGAQQVQTGQDGLALQIHFHGLTGVGTLLGQHMHQQENSQVVHDCGDSGGLADGHVGNAQHFRHQEGAGAHNGRHDLTAGGSGGLNGTGFLGGVAHLLHHGDGHNAGAGHVGGGGAGDHAHQAGGHNGCLGRAGVVVGAGTELDADVDQNLAAAAGAEQGAEDHDPVHEAGARAGGGAVDTFTAHDHQVSELVDVHALVEQDAGKPPGSPDISDEHADENHQGLAHGTGNAQQNQQNQGDALEDIDGVHGIQVVDPQTQPVKLADGVPDVVEEGNKYEPVADGVKDFSGLAGVLAGIQQHAQEADAGNVDRTHQHGNHGVDKRSVQLEQQVCQGDPHRGGCPGGVLDQGLLDLLPNTLLFKCIAHKTMFLSLCTGRMGP